MYCLDKSVQELSIERKRWRDGMVEEQGSSGAEGKEKLQVSERTEKSLAGAGGEPE